MPGIRWFVACLGVCLFASPCAADDETAVERISISLTALYAAASAADSNRYFTDHEPMAPLRFQRSDTFGRMIRIRSVSLLTLSESRSSRFFFGVNSDGYLGFHLRGSSDRHVEVARMPWLQRGARPAR